MQKWQVFDWMNNRIELKEWPPYWESFDAAEYDLSVFLGDDYEALRQEYYIELVDEEE